MSDGGSSWRVSAARFECSAPDLARCPDPGPPEVAVAGRSNVGKSSLLNAFTGQTGLARVSRAPGRTRLLNYFAIDLHRGSQRLPIRWVDLPGYGFAQVHKSVRAGFGPMIEGYLGGRETLKLLVLLIDARRGWTDVDRQMLDAAVEAELQVLLCATKADKLTKSERGLLASKIAKPIGVDPRDVLLTSSAKGTGLDGRGLAGDLAAILGEPAS